MNPALILQQFRFTHFVVSRNLEGIDHGASCRVPDSGASSLNWVVGHVVHARNGILRALGRAPAIEPERIERYARGSTAPDGAAAVPLADLLAAFHGAQQEIEEGLAALPAERLSDPAPFSPLNRPDETLGSLLAGLAFHEAYHSGQMGVLRRVLGLPGAIR